MTEPAVRSRALVLAAVISLSVSCSVIEPGALGSFFLPVPGDPLVHVCVLVKVGSAHDPTGKDGLCLLTCALAASGSARAPSLAGTAPAPGRRGPGISVSVDKEASVFSASVPREDLEAFYPVFKDIFLSPRFPAEELDRLKADRILRFEYPADAEDVGSYSRDALDRLIFRGHPYGRASSAAAETIAGVTTVDARVFHAQHFVRGNIVVGAAGGYPADFPDRVRRDFERLPAGFTPALRLPSPERPNGPEILIAEAAGAGAAVSLGCALDRGMTDEESAALRIAAACLGGNGADALIPDRFRRQRIFLLPLAADAGDPFAAVPASLAAFRALVAGGIPEDRFEPVRRALFDEAQSAAGRPAGRLRKRLASFSGEDESADQARELEILVDLRRSDVDRAMRKYLDPDRVGIAVVAGDGEAARRSLAAGVPGANIRVLPAAEVFAPAAPRSGAK